jgi:CrcB protein
MLQAAAVCVGACAGALLRWRLGVWLNTPQATLPWGTLLANGLGGFLVGLVLGVLSLRPELSPLWKLLLVTGFLGALTTFSSFSAESLALIQAGRVGLAVIHTLAHVLVSLGLAWVGFGVAGAWR